MKMFMLLSCLFGSTMAAISGDLTVTYTEEFAVVVQGQLTGLPADTTDAGIHIHAGKDCTYAEAVGGHLWSNYIDGWAYPAAITYDTSETGEAAVNARTSYFVLAEDEGTDAIPAVENRCIVLHGLSTDSMGTRVAVGQILKDSDGNFKAAIGKYPGPGNTIETTPAGELTVTLGDGNEVVLQGTLTGLAASLTGAGIHIHTGTDCAGGDDLSSDEAVNAVIGGHLYSKGDGFLTTTYTSDANGEANVDFSTPANGYTLLTTEATDPSPSVQDRCIVVHDDASARIGAGQIVCTDDGCTATMGDYPPALCQNNDANDGCATENDACQFVGGSCTFTPTTTTPKPAASNASAASVTAMMVVAAMLW